MEMSVIRELSNGHSNVVPINLALRFDQQILVSIEEIATRLPSSFTFRKLN